MKVFAFWPLTRTYLCMYECETHSYFLYLTQEEASVRQISKTKYTPFCHTCKTKAGFIDTSGLEFNDVSNTIQIRENIHTYFEMAINDDRDCFKAYV